MVTRSLVAISSQRTVLGSRLAATTRATRSRSVTIATTRPPSTTGSGPFSLAIISLATSTTLIDGATVTTLAVMTCLTWGRPPACWRRRQRRRASRSAAEVSVGSPSVVVGGVTSAGTPSPARCLPVLRLRASTAAPAARAGTAAQGSRQDVLPALPLRVVFLRRGGGAGELLEPSRSRRPHAGQPLQQQ